MSRLIQNLQIKNFKSIRDLSLDCDRINIFIGKPNAGKSNILEAISLLGAGYSISHGRFMEGFIRYKTIVQLFSSLEYRNPIKVRINEHLVTLKASEKGSDFEFLITYLPSEREDLKYYELPNSPVIHPPILTAHISLDGSFRQSSFNDVPKEIKKYTFRPFGDYKEHQLFLQPPYGENFFLIAQGNDILKAEIKQFLEPNGLDFLFDVETQQMSVLQKGKDSYIRIPMLLVPDTFQRYIFHLAAILSNQNSVLLFEEPETHSYPPYVYQLAQHILQDDRNNQYFLTTHNPYLLTPILEETKDVALFVTWFENYQTHARRLTPDEIGEVLNDGLDVFLNLNHFVPVHE